MTRTKNITSTSMSVDHSEVLNIDTQSRLQRLIKEESKIVKGRFRCFDSPGSRQRIQVRKYKEVPMFDKWMTDGEAYEIPLYVARHLNGIDAVAEGLNGKIGSCSYPIHGFKWETNRPMPHSQEGLGPNNEFGIPIPLTNVAKRVRRFGFESLEFGLDDS